MGTNVVIVIERNGNFLHVFNERLLDLKYRCDMTIFVDVSGIAHILRS